MTKTSTRRDLLKNTAVGGAALAATSLFAACSKSEKKPAPEAPAKAAEAPKADAVPYVDPASNKAKALRYTEDASTVAAEVRVDKGNTKGAEQFCNNCQFYSAGNGEGGKCALFPGKLVKDQAWCVSWGLKAQS